MAGPAGGGYGFGKLLASTEKADRDKAVRAIGAWLVKRSDVSDQDLAKLWKGIFYCFWLSDKPKIQQQLADRLAKMSVALPPDLSLKFLRQFWLTMIREWHGIDRLRMDKYYFLCRRFLRRTLQMLADLGWPESWTSTFSTTLSSTLLDVKNTKIPDGLRYHSVETFLEELGNCFEGDDKAKSEADLQTAPAELFRPFILAVAGSSNKQLRNLVHSEVLAKLYQDPSNLPFLVDHDALASIIRETAKLPEFQGRDYLKDDLVWAGKVLGPEVAKPDVDSSPEKPAPTTTSDEDTSEKKQKKRKRTSRRDSDDVDEAPQLVVDDDEAPELTTNGFADEAGAADENNDPIVKRSAPHTPVPQSPARSPAKEKVAPATDRPKKRRLSDAQEPDVSRPKRRVSWGPNATKTFHAKVPLAKFGTAKDLIKEAKLKSPKKPVLVTRR